MHNPHWINDTIRHGLAKLLSLRLNGCPPNDVMELTTRTWLEAVTVGREWEFERDEPRMRAAFIELERTRESWPAPKHFFDALPQVSRPMLMLTKEHRPASPEQRKAAVAKINAMLRGSGVVR